MRGVTGNSFNYNNRSSDHTDLMRQAGVLKGDILKAATWRAPAKHVRGSIYDKKQTWFHWTGPRYLTHG